MANKYLHLIVLAELMEEEDDQRGRHLTSNI